MAKHAAQQWPIQDLALLGRFQHLLVLKLGQDGGILEANEASGQFLGCAPASLEGQSFPALLGPYERRCREVLAACCAQPGKAQPFSLSIELGDTQRHARWEWVALPEPGGGLCAVGIGCDITPQVQQLLRAGRYEQRWLGLFNALDMVVYHRPLQHFEEFSINPAFQRLTGHSAEELRARPALLFELVHPEDRPAFAAWLKGLEHGEAQPFSYRIVTKQGELRHLYDKPTLYVDIDGRQMVTGIVADLTEMKHLQANMEAKARRLRSVVENLPDGFFALDREWRFIYANPQFEREMRIDAAAVLGRSIWEVFPDANSLQFHKAYHHVMERREAVLFEEYAPRLKAWFNTLAYPTDEGISVIYRNITADKERQLELERVRANLAALLNASADLVWAVDADLNVLFANEAFRKTQYALNGHVIEEGKPVLREWSASERAERWRAYYARALGGEIFQCEESAELGSEGRVYMETSFTPLRDSRGALISCLCISRNITQRKHYEQRIRYQNEQLRRIAQDQSHGVRRPLANILGLVQLFDLDAVPPGQRELIEHLRASAIELDQVVQEVVARTNQVERQHGAK